MDIKSSKEKLKLNVKIKNQFVKQSQCGYKKIDEIICGYKCGYNMTLNIL